MALNYSIKLYFVITEKKCMNISPVYTVFQGFY